MQNDKVLIENWLLKAREAIDDAESLIESGRLSSAQNRLYYGLFYAVMALAQSKNFITSKHSGMISWFNREYIKSGVFSIEMGKLYKTAYDNRQKCDYTITFKPEKDVLMDSLNKSVSFIKNISEEIDNSL